uniref:Amidohydro-rel domain-containing protein n=1 Tax=Toxocara canis TaxID=6265 RepID=A0A183U644_TOXCA
LINAALRPNQPATLIIKGIELSDEVQLKSVIVNGREIQWKTSDVIAE